MTKINLMRAALLALFFSAPQFSFAQNLGIDFASMPVGTKMTYKRDDGLVYTDTFMGKRGRYYLVNRAGKTKAGKTYWQKRRFDKAGRFVAYSFGNNTGSQPGKIFFKPYDCEYQIGACKMQRKLVAHNYGDNGSGYSAAYTTQKFKGGYLVKFNRDDRAAGGEYYFETGKYNLRTSVIFGARANRWEKLVKIH